jgi:trk system potassium uptake protein TrkH
MNLYGNVFSSLGESLRHSSFQVVTIISTTGYSSTDFEKWGMFSKIILFMLMFIGGCAGSTGGAIKNVRFLLLFKIMKRELLQIIHPKAVYSIRFDKRAVDEKTLSEVLGFFFMPLTMLAYALAINAHGSLSGFYLFLFVVAVLLDLGTHGAGPLRKHRRERQ